MKNNAYYKLNREPDIISGFRRTLAEIEWLLLVLVLFYLVVGNINYDTKQILIFVSCLYTGVVISFQYWNFFKETKEWKIAFQTWAMIIFISWLIWYTGKLQSPLFNLYLLPVLASAITLGKLATLLEVGLIFSIFMYLENGFHKTEPYSLFSMSGSSDVLMLFFPMLLVAYISTMLASDIQSGFNKLKVISEVDDLTKLFNHRAFNALSEKSLKQAERHHWHVSVLMLDVDNLKKTNDSHGHEAGNILLANIAQCLDSVLREGDMAARYGGDEFVTLLTDCDRNDAIQVANRIIEQFNSAQVRYRGEDIKLSASIGIASFPEHGQTIDVLLEKADKAMYFSKRQGNNLVTIYTPELNV